MILRPGQDRTLAWSWARWSLVPPGAREVPPYPLNNARSDKLGSWPWKAVQRRRCLVPASGFREPEKPAREKGVAPWSHYSMRDGRPFFMAGLWAEAHDPATGEVADSYTVIITDANAAMRVHDRMPVVLAPDAARQWIEPGPLPAELLVPYPAEAMVGWRVADAAKNSRIEPTTDMAEPIAADRREGAGRKKGRANTRPQSRTRRNNRHTVESAWEMRRVATKRGEPERAPMGLLRGTCACGEVPWRRATPRPAGQLHDVMRVTASDTMPA